MGFKSLIISFVVLTVSCSTVQEGHFELNNSNFQVDNLPKFNIKLKSLVHSPYCGGAYPDESQKNGYISPSGQNKYIITTDSINKSSGIKTSIIKADDGLFHISVNTGKYYVFQVDKNLPLKDFMERHQGNQYIKADSSCFKKWKNSPDFSFLAEKDTTYEIMYRSRCFTGTYPCIEYNGPYPP